MFKGAKPKEALKRLRLSIAEEGADQECWIKKARIATVLGSCPKSHASFKSGLLPFIAVLQHPFMLACSGLRNWCELAEIFYGHSTRGFPGAHL